MITIYAECRKNIGKGHSRKIRIQNKCPAIIYGKNKPNIPIVFNQNILSNIKKNILNTSTVKIIINDSYHIVKTCQIQYHPFKKKIIHIDFLYLK